MGAVPASDPLIPLWRIPEMIGTRNGPVGPNLSGVDLGITTVEPPRLLAGEARHPRWISPVIRGLHRPERACGRRPIGGTGMPATATGPSPGRTAAAASRNDMTAATIVGRRWTRIVRMTGITDRPTARTRDAGPLLAAAATRGALVGAAEAPRPPTGAGAIAAAASRRSRPSRQSCWG